MASRHYFDDIAFTSLREDLEGVSKGSLRSDLMAAFTVALLTIPQTLAYALVAGLPLSTAIYSAIFSAAIASFFGCSRHLVVGPSNAIAIMLQAGLADVMQGDMRATSGWEREMLQVELLAQLAFLVALLQGGFAFFKLGRLTNFVSHSVVVGYLLGVAFAVIVTQGYVLLGIPSPEGGATVYEKARALVSGLKDTHFSTLLIGCLSLFTLVGIKKWDSKLPAGAIMIAFVSLFLFLEKTIVVLSAEDMEWMDDDLFQIAVVSDTAMLTQLTPHLFLPDFNLKVLNQLLPFAFAIALIGILESSSIAKSIAASSGQRLSINQETLGLSVGNLVSSLFGAMPISGSPTRSALNYSSGAKSRFAAILCSLIVASIMLLFVGLIGYIPLAALAALLIVSTPRIVDPAQLRLCLRATRSDAAVLWITFISCLFFDLNVAFYIGIALSITLYLKKAAIPELLEFTIDEKGSLRQIQQRERKENRIRIVKVEGELFFGAAELFHTTLKGLAQGGERKAIILQLKNARDMDATSCLALRQLASHLKSKGHALFACGMTAEVWQVFLDSAIADEMGRGNLFPFDPANPNRHMQLAWERANAFVEGTLSLEEEITPEENPVVLQEAKVKGAS
ncbi:SulP family inorganic anion transporter [Estrella lausannensis]|nr:SulP family inorganic anion transporter [Estrella lausannensis]